MLILLLCHQLPKNQYKHQHKWPREMKESKQKTKKTKKKTKQNKNKQTTFTNLRKIHPNYTAENEILGFRNTVPPKSNRHRRRTTNRTRPKQNPKQS